MAVPLRSMSDPDQDLDREVRPAQGHGRPQGGESKRCTLRDRLRLPGSSHGPGRRGVCLRHRSQQREQREDWDLGGCHPPPPPKLCTRDFQAMPRRGGWRERCGPARVGKCGCPPPVTAGQRCLRQTEASEVRCRASLCLCSPVTWRCCPRLAQPGACCLTEREAGGAHCSWAPKAFLRSRPVPRSCALLFAQTQRVSGRLPVGHREHPAFGSLPCWPLPLRGWPVRVRVQGLLG